jgi:hypothetical protein
MTAHRRKMLAFAGAVFLFGVGFAAEPTARRTDAGDAASAAPGYWVPGSSIPMSAYEQSASLMPMPH